MPKQKPVNKLSKQSSSKNLEFFSNDSSTPIMESLEVLHLGYNGIKDMSTLQLSRLTSLKALFLQGKYMYMQQLPGTDFNVTKLHVNVLTYQSTRISILMNYFIGQFLFYKFLFVLSRNFHRLSKCIFKGNNSKLKKKKIEILLIKAKINSESVIIEKDNIL